jgi:hypothetical protein
MLKNFKITEEHKKILKYVGIAALATAGIGAVYWYFMGFNQKVEFHEEPIPAQLIIYKNNLGPYGNVGPLYGEFDQKLKKSFSGTYLFGLFTYDNPGTVKDHSQLRSSIVAFVDLSMKAAAEEFVKAYPEYKLKEIPEVKAIRAPKMLFKGTPVFLMKITSIFGQLFKYLHEHKLVSSQNEVGPAVEIYYPCTGHGFDFEMMATYGKNAANLWLTTDPVPK